MILLQICLSIPACFLALSTAENSNHLSNVEAWLISVYRCIYSVYVNAEFHSAEISMSNASDMAVRIGHNISAVIKWKYNLSISISKSLT